MEPNSIQVLRFNPKNLEIAMRGFVNKCCASIHVRVALTLVWHTIGRSRKNLERHLREAKA